MGKIDLKLLISDTETDHPYRWRDRHGGFHDPRKMETRHIFYVIRMIWNHTMPEAARFPVYKKYVFEAFYTDRYLKQSIRVLLRELSTRTDLTPVWLADLNHMIDWFNTVQIIPQLGVRNGENI